jgi:hypothetical protein
MTDSPPPRSRLPHWGWFLLTAIVLVVGFAGLSIWLPSYREQQVIQRVEELGGRVETKTDNPDWLKKLVGEDRLNESKLYMRASTVQLSGPEITDSQVAQLNGLSRLRGLDLRRTAVTDSGLALLSGLTSLKYLNLDRTLVTDNGLTHLQRFPILRTLSLDRTAITDNGLMHLNRITTLRRLHITGTTVTDHGIEALQRALPDCEIRH